MYCLVILCGAHNSADASEDSLVNNIDEAINGFKKAMERGDTLNQSITFNYIHSRMYHILRISDRKTRESAIAHVFLFFSENIGNLRFQALAIGGMGRLSAQYPELLTAKIRFQLRKEFARQFEGYISRDSKYPQYNCLNTMTAVLSTLSTSNSKDLHDILYALNDIELKWTQNRRPPTILEKISSNIEADKHDVIPAKDTSERLYATIQEFVGVIAMPPASKQPEWIASIAKLSGTDGQK